MVRAGRQPRDGRRVQLGADRAVAGRARLRVARRGARPAARARHRGRPRHADRLAAAVAGADVIPRRFPSTADGVRLVAGSRNQFSPASRVYREHALAITRDLADRYAEPPGGADVARRQRVRPDRLRRRGGAQSSATGCADGTARSTRSTTRGAPPCGRSAIAPSTRSCPPRRMPYLVNPAQSLDFRRYTLRPAAAVLPRAARRDPRGRRRRSRSPRTSWASRRSSTTGRGPARSTSIADDQYPDPGAAAGVGRHRPRAGPHALARRRPAVGAHGAGGRARPHWRSHNLPKRRCEARLDSLQAVARGADAVCFFQWRQSAAGAERFHSAMLPHAGPDTEVFAGVCALGDATCGGCAPSSAPGPHPSPCSSTGRRGGRRGAGSSDRPAATRSTRSRWYRLLWRRAIAVDLVAGRATTSRGTRWCSCRTATSSSRMPRPPLSPRSWSRRERSSSGRSAASPIRTAGILQGRSPVLLRDLLGVSGEEWVRAAGRARAARDRRRAGSRRRHDAGSPRSSASGCAPTAPRCSPSSRRATSREPGHHPPRRRAGTMPGTSAPSSRTTRSTP